jgi:hypothetical protein
MNWRGWLYARLQDPDIDLAPNQIHSSGSVDKRPDKLPAVVVRIMPRISAVKSGAAHRQRVQLWVHDRPGSYVAIDGILADLRANLPGQVGEAGGIACEWLDESQDLSDEAWGTGTRYSTFQLIGTS